MRPFSAIAPPTIPDRGWLAPSGVKGTHWAPSPQRAPFPGCSPFAGPQAGPVHKGLRAPSPVPVPSSSLHKRQSSSAASRSRGTAKRVWETLGGYPGKVVKSRANTRGLRPQPPQRAQKAEPPGEKKLVSSGVAEREGGREAGVENAPRSLVNVVTGEMGTRGRGTRPWQRATCN